MIVLFLILALQAPPVVDLPAAKNLYASGDYEEALKKLPPSTGDADGVEADQYRALCLLALGRANEAEQAVEALVRRRPLFKMSEAEVSPRLVSMFRDARKRLLPSLIRDLYGKARANFDQKNFDTASAQLKDLMTLVGDEDLGDNAVGLSDLKMVAEGFLKLADAEVANRAKADAAAASSQKAAEAENSPNRLFSSEDKDVKPPIDISTSMPEWRPPDSVASKSDFRGVLRIVIDQRGKVESASMVQTAHATYDSLLLAAVRNWQFRPATRNGQPVKYVKLIAVTLSGR